MLRVAIAYDASVASQYAVEELLRFDWGANTELVVAGVAGYSPIFDPEYGFNPKSIRKEAEDALLQAVEHLQPKVHHVGSRLIEYDHVAEGLVRFTEDEEIDLLVIGDTGRSNLARALLGSVSRFVLRHAQCGVWVTRNRKRADSTGTRHDQSDNMAGAN
jgi:nucleotide-binding universal stress UspA family protein